MTAPIHSPISHSPILRSPISHSPISHWLCVSAFLLQLGMAGAQTGPAYLVADINEGTEASRFNPRFYAELDGWLYFAAHTPSTGQELFRTDGTTEGTELVADLCVGACSSQVINTAAVFEGELYFVACVGEFTGCGLWKTDGNNVAPVFEALVWEIMPNEGALYVGTILGEVLRTDGRGPGTLVFKAGAVPRLMLPAEDGLYIWVTDLANITAAKVGELWYTDGTEAGSRLIHSAGDLVLSPFLFNGRALFSAEGRLWLGDLSGAEPLFADPPFTSPAVIGAANGVLFVRSNFQQLWRSDGTVAGTAFLDEAIFRDELDPMLGFAEILSQVHEGELYFAHREVSPVLFRTTGGAGKTAIHEFPDAVQSLHVIDDLLYVVTQSRFSTPRSPTLWRVDAGSAAVTRVVTLADGEFFGDLVSYQGTLIFDRLSVNGIGVASQLAIVNEDAGEVVVLGGRESGASSDPQELTRDRHQVLFRLPETFDSWASDGSAEGTFRATGPSVFDPIVQAGDEAFVRASGLRRVNEDGSLTLIFEPPAGETFVPDDAVVIDRGVLLVTESADGLGRFYLADHDSGSLEFLADSFRRFTDFGRDLVQSAPLGDGVLLILNEEVVWRSDGTPGGTWQVLDVTALGDGSVTEPVRVGEWVYFASSMRQEAPRLWRSDGTPKGTVVVLELPKRDGGDEFPPALRDLTSVGDQLFFVLDEPNHGAELWTSDGSPEGTVLVRDIRLGEGSSAPRHLTALKVATGIGKAARQRLFFSADDGALGRELWTSDGSAEGTASVLDLWPGQRGSDPRELTVAFGHLVFAADDGVHGMELWVSDGSASGTRLLQDLQPGPLPSDPHSFTVTDELVFFNAYFEATGAELWALPASALFDLRSPPVQPRAAGLTATSENLEGLPQ